MNKKASMGGILRSNAIYIFLLIVFFVGMRAFIINSVNSASIWEDYYAKEIAKVIDMAEPGDEIVLDVHKATEVAKKNNIANFEEIFSFNNLDNEVCVKLSLGRASCYNYFNDVGATYSKDSGEKWIAFAEPVNRLHFSVFEEAG